MIKIFQSLNNRNQFIYTEKIFRIYKYKKISDIKFNIEKYIIIFDDISEICNQKCVAIGIKRENISILRDKYQIVSWIDSKNVVIRSMLLTSRMRNRQTEGVLVRRIHFQSGHPIIDSSGMSPIWNVDLKLKKLNKSGQYIFRHQSSSKYLYMQNTLVNNINNLGGFWFYWEANSEDKILNKWLYSS